MDFNFYSWCIMYCIYIIYILYTTSPSFFKGSFLPFIFAPPPFFSFYSSFLCLSYPPSFSLPLILPSLLCTLPLLLPSLLCTLPFLSSLFSEYSFLLSYFPFPSFLPYHLHFFLIHVHGPNPFSHLFWTPLTFSSLLFFLIYSIFFLSSCILNSFLSHYFLSIPNQSGKSGIIII